MPVGCRYSARIVGWRIHAGTAVSRSDRTVSGTNGAHYLTLLGLQSRFGDILLIFRIVYPQNGTAALKGLIQSPF